MWSELAHLLTDPAHWAFEGITDLVYGGIGAVFGAIWVRRHDRKHHAEPTDATFVTYKGLVEILAQRDRAQAQLQEMRERRYRRR